MCRYCDYNSKYCEIFFEPLTKEWYLRYSYWGGYNDDFVDDKIYISYCPYCGEDLYKISKDW